MVPTPGRARPLSAAHPTCSEVPYPRWLISWRKTPDRRIEKGYRRYHLVIGTSVMVGVAGVETLARDGCDLAPVATVAELLVGRWGAVLMTVAAVLAFSSVANAGILSASRYPLAMGRDKILPTVFSRIGSRGTPAIAIAVTVGLILLSVTLFDPTKIAKLASAFQLVMFALACLAVIVMRESGIESYDPGYRAPMYPGIQVLGILAPLWLIVNMGLLPSLFTGGLITFGATWYAYYARHRVSREGAISWRCEARAQPTRLMRS